MDDEQHFRMSGGCEDYDKAGDEIEMSNAIPTISQQRRAATELERFDLATSDLDGYEGDNGNDVEADEKEDALEADDGSTQNLED
jgi:hypothetical protein